MTYSVFNKKSFNFLDQPMFFGEPVNVSRFDIQKHPAFEQTTKQQLGFFWVPEEINVDKDRRDFYALEEHQQHIFLGNLKYQTLLDSVQGRSPNVAFLPIVSDPALENWIETWSFSEGIHSRSYTHIMRNVLSNPSDTLDSIVSDTAIQKRAVDVTRYYDELIRLNSIRMVVEHHPELASTLKYNEYEHKVALFMAMMAVNCLEAVRFYVSFACSFAFAENDVMNGNATIIKLISRDEALHLKATEYIINSWRRGKDDPVMEEISHKYHKQASKIFHDAIRQEEEWGEFLFSKGSMLGLNENIIKQYIRYIGAKRMAAIKIQPEYDVPENPLPWMSNWINSGNVQTTPQEKELSSYIVGGLDTSLDNDFMGSLSL